MGWMIVYRTTGQCGGFLRIVRNGRSEGLYQAIMRAAISHEQQFVTVNWIQLMR